MHLMELDTADTPVSTLLGQGPERGTMQQIREQEQVLI